MDMRSKMVRIIVKYGQMDNIGTNKWSAVDLVDSIA